MSLTLRAVPYVVEDSGVVFLGRRRRGRAVNAAGAHAHVTQRRGAILQARGGRRAVAALAGRGPVSERLWRQQAFRQAEAGAALQAGAGHPV